MARKYPGYRIRRFHLEIARAPGLGVRILLTLMTRSLSTTLFRLLASLALGFALGSPASAQSDAPTPSSELSDLVKKIGDKIRSGDRSAEALAPELAAFDALRTKYRGKTSADVARIALMHASLYGEVIGDHEKAKALFLEMKKEFEGTAEARQADGAIAALERAAATKKAKEGLVGKPAPALDFTWSTREGLKSLADLKGKVVVIDFWATWCGPCLTSFPQVRELTSHYEGLDVVVVGVTSIQGFVANLGSSRIDTKDDPKREMELMRDFIKAKNMTWPVVFSEQPVFNEAYGVSGIPHMAIIAPDGTVRHNGIHPAAPHGEKVEKIDALLKEFGKKTKA